MSECQVGLSCSLIKGMTDKIILHPFRRPQSVASSGTGPLISALRIEGSEEVKQVDAGTGQPQARVQHVVFGAQHRVAGVHFVHDRRPARRQFVSDQSRCLPRFLDRLPEVLHRQRQTRSSPTAPALRSPVVRPWLDVGAGPIRALPSGHRCSAPAVLVRWLPASPSGSRTFVGSRTSALRHRLRKAPRSLRNTVWRISTAAASASAKSASARAVRPVSRPKV